MALMGAASADGTSPDILVVDDEAEVREILRHVLEREGFAVREAADGEAALEAVRATMPGLVVLDLGLPGHSGLDVLRALKADSRVPVIVVSGMSDEADRVVGLELGADDYVTKPFSPREVVARVKNILRRSTPDAGGDVLAFDGLTLDLAAREVRCNGALIDLTNREFDLVSFLASSPRRVFSADQLLKEVWGAEPGWQSPNTVSEHVYRIRRHLETDPRRPRWIVTVRGAGYRFDP